MQEHNEIYTIENISKDTDDTNEYIVNFEKIGYNVSVELIDDAGNDLISYNGNDIVIDDVISLSSSSIKVGDSVNLTLLNTPVGY